MTTPPTNENQKHVPAPIAGNRSGAGELLQLLRDGRARTRTELALETGAARSTVASRIEMLMLAGFVCPAGETGSSGGRPPSTFAFNHAARVVLAVHVGPTHIAMALTDLDGNAQAEHRLEQVVSDGPEPVLDIVIARGLELLAAAARRPYELAGIGIALPGPVDHQTGRPAKPQDMPGWDGFDVVRYIQRSLPVPVLVDSEVNVMVLGERTQHWPEHEDILFIHVDTGINAGIISNGRLQRGATGAAGALGSVRVPRADQILCSCGNDGCLEAIATLAAVGRALTAQGLEARTEVDVLRLINGGNRQAIQAVRQAGRDIGDVLAAAVNLLNPSVIVVGGSFAEAGEHLVAGIREVVFHRSPPSTTLRLSIGMSMRCDRAAILGASHMVTQHVLTPEAVEATLRTVLKTDPAAGSLQAVGGTTPGSKERENVEKSAVPAWP